MRLAIAALLTSLSSPAWAQDVFSDQIRVIGIGIACGQDGSDQVEAPDTVAGSITLIDDTPIIISESRQVPAVPGLSFGIIFEVLGQDRIYVHNIATHPNFPGHNVTRQTFASSYSPGEHFRFYQFDFDYERQPGPWVLEAQTPLGTLYRTEFTVVEPTADHPLASICNFGDLLS